MNFSEPKRASVYGTAVVHTFATSAELIDFAGREAELWTPLSGASQGLSNPVRSRIQEQSTFYDQLRSAAVAADNTSQQEPNNNQQAYLAQIDQRLNQISTGMIITSESRGAATILKLAETDPGSAAHLAYLASPVSSSNMGLFNGGINVRQILRALFDASGVDGHRHGVDLVTAQMGKLISSVEAKSAEMSGAAQERDARWVDLRREVGQALSDWETNENNSRSERQEAWATRQEEIEEEWRGIKRALDERVTLAAPTEYWRDRAKKLTKLAIGFSVSFALLIATLVTGFVHWGLPYLAGVSAASGAGRHVDVLIGILPLLVPAFCGIWALRILGRLLASYLRLSEDARERKTMVETFLALSKEGADGNALLRPEDRHLILKALFRPGDGSTVDDSPPVGIIDQLSKFGGGVK